MHGDTQLKLMCGYFSQKHLHMLTSFALISVNLDWLTHEPVCWVEQRRLDGPYQITNSPIIFDLLSKVRTQEKG